MSDIRIKVRTREGQSHPVDVPEDMMTAEFLHELIDGLQLATTDAEGHPITWTLLNNDTGLTLDPQKTLTANGVRNGHSLHFDVPQPSKSNIKVHVHFPNGDAHLEEVSPDYSSGKLIADLILKLRRAGNGVYSDSTKWTVDDKDTGKTLDPEKSIQENGVRTGHHLYVHEVQQKPGLWDRIKLPVGIGVGLVAILAILWIAFPTRPSSITLALTPTAATMSAGQEQAFNVTFSGSDNNAVVWSISPEFGTISQEGIYRAPATIIGESTVAVTATSRADTTKSARAEVVLKPSRAIVVSPTTVTLNGSEQAGFTATIEGNRVPKVEWSLDPMVGEVSTEGVYTAPTSVPSPQTITVIATSAGDDVTRVGSASIMLKPITIILNPTSGAPSPGETIRFSATVDGASDRAVIWAVSGPGSISPLGVYAAPPSSVADEKVTVTATSRADRSKSASAVLTLKRTPDGGVKLPTVVAVSLNPSTANLVGSQQQTFMVSVTGSSDNRVAWSVSGPGSVSNGVYAAPSVVSAAQTVTVTATSVADMTKSAIATINLIPVSLSVNPPNATLTAAQQQRFLAPVTGSSNTSVNWSLAGPGNISPDGIYTAPASIAAQSTVRITATSEADPSKSVSASITLRPTPPVDRQVRVCFYRDIQYVGDEQCYTPGQEVARLGPLARTFSSIRISGGARVTVFENRDFEGRTAEFSSDVDDLGRRMMTGNRPWNDEIESLRVSPPGPQPGGDRVCVYDRTDYRGRSECWAPGVDLPDLARMGDWSDKISSVRVFGRAVAVVYQDIGFAGSRKIIDQDTPDMGKLPLDGRNWNDGVSSIQVRMQGQR